MDILIIICLSVLIFVLGLLTTKLWDLFSIWKKAKQAGLTPNWKEIFYLAKFYELEDWFLQACKNFKELDNNISIVDIVHHHMADGDTISFLAYCTEAIKLGIETSTHDLMMLHLAGKDLQDEPLPQVIELNLEFELNDWLISYSGSIKTNPDSRRWISYNDDAIKNSISSAIQKHIQENGLTTETNILEEVLNVDFWQTICHGESHNQSIKLNPR